MKFTYRLNYIHDSFLIGATIGDQWMEYEEGDKERLYGISLLFGVAVLRIGFIKQIDNLD